MELYKSVFFFALLDINTIAYFHDKEYIFTKHMYLKDVQIIPFSVTFSGHPLSIANTETTCRRLSPWFLCRNRVLSPFP